jgi:glycerol-3-phosphate dehydrogenase
MDRERLLESLGERPFDLIVVGAGINGAGIARDAAMRGMRTLLVDKSDISSGTTQWATRLIHGGLRYLEYYELHLVRESLGEREKLFHIAPHLVKPRRFVVPIYERSKRGPRLIRLGMIAYDVLSYDKSVPNHRMLSREQTLEQYPGLNPEGLLGAATYYDGQAEYAERIAVENAISAAQHGATVITYAEVKRLLSQGGGNGALPRVVGVEFEDRLGGGGTYQVRAPVTVNVAGPWVDRVLSGTGAFGFTGDPTTGVEEGRMIGGTKGSHIVVDPFPGAPTEDAIYVEARKDGRPYFIVPWNGRYLIGTTDLRYEGDLDYVSADDDEIDYLIEETNAVVPEANLTREDVLFTYSGVRPLPYAPAGAEGSITRSHVVFDHARGKSVAGGRIKVAGSAPRAEGLISIVGGKLTTYRNLGRQTVDIVYKKLGAKAPESATDRVPLPGGQTPDFNAFAREFKERSGLPEVLSSRLLKVYGARAYDVLDEAGDAPSLKEPLNPSAPTVETGIIGAEVLYAFRREMAQKLADVLLRRTMVAYGPQVALDVDEAAAKVAVKHLGWSRERAEREVRDYREWIERYKPKAFREHESAGAPGDAG